MSARGQNFRRETYRFAEVSGQRRERGQKKIAEAVAFKSGAFLKSMLKNFCEQSLIFRQSNNAIAHVAGRKHVELFAEASARPAIVSYRDHSAEFGDTRGSVRVKRSSHVYH